MNVKRATKTVNYNDKWDEFQQSGIDVLVNYLTTDMDEPDKIQDVKNQQVFTNKEFMRLYKIIYDLCIVPKGNFAKLLYTRYIDVTSKYLLDMVLPNLTDATGVILLKKLANHWEKHTIFVKWLSK